MPWWLGATCFPVQCRAKPLRERKNFVARLDDAFSEEKSGDKFEIVAGGCAGLR